MAKSPERDRQKERQEEREREHAREREGSFSGSPQRQLCPNHHQLSVRSMTSMSVGRGKILYRAGDSDHLCRMRPR